MFNICWWKNEQIWVRINDLIPNTLFSPPNRIQEGKSPHREHLTKSLVCADGWAERSVCSVACRSSLHSSVAEHGLQPQCGDSKACVLLALQNPVPTHFPQACMATLVNPCGVTRIPTGCHAAYFSLLWMPSWPQTTHRKSETAAKVEKYFISFQICQKPRNGLSPIPGCGLAF